MDKVHLAVLILAVLAGTATLIYLADENSITGYVFAKLRVTGTAALIDCQVRVEQGWNLLSIPCQTEDDNLSTIFATLNSSYESIHKFMTNDEHDPWKSYKPDLPSWVIQDFESLSNKEGFWIRANQSGEIHYTGAIVLPNVITLSQGWNLVGYPTNYTKTTSNAFSTISGQLASAHMFNASDSDQWKVYSPTIPNSAIDFNHTTPGYGIWLNMTSGAVWTILGGES